MDVNNKVAIVTGGIKGIGFVTVQHLLRNGAQYVAIFDWLKADSDEAVNALKKLEQEFNILRFGHYHCNVVNLQEFIACYDQVIDLKKNVDILINNAGIYDDKNLQLTIDVNLTAVIHCTMHAVSRMGTHKLGKGGVIVNIGSISAFINVTTVPVYSATKNAVVSFVKSMKEHNEKLGVRIVCVCPGMTRTDVITNCVGRDLVFDFVSQKAIDEHLGMYLQDPNTVASTIVDIVKRGKGGDIWIVHDDEPAFKVKDESNIEDLKIAL